ncbi:MAG: GMC family oxidoreductase [Deltaproteobacteria bacterium]|nr:GMC family oxidoreductase [Deltaproteobacteria bacterium]
MIFDARDLRLPGRLEADLCVVGSGPGGATAAMVAAEAGLRVVVLEAGELVTPSMARQREEVMLPRLYWESGSRTTLDRRVHVHQGRGVGGSALHNLNLIKRIPDALLERWRAAGRLEHLGLPVWHALYEELEALLEVKEIPADERSPHNLLLKAGAEALGWRSGPLSHNRTGCKRSGFCELGCAYDGKNNPLKKMAPRIVAAGGTILTCVQAVRLRQEGGRARGVEAVVRAPLGGAVLGRVEIVAPRVCLSASATGTAALLLRSRVPDRSGRTGQGLHLHPGVFVAGEFEGLIEAQNGVPQSWECTEWLDLASEEGHGLWLIPSFAHPGGAATMMPGAGEEHFTMMERYPHLAVFSAMLHDRSEGRVAPEGDLGLTIRYRPGREDRRELALGQWACARLLLAAGARRVLVPESPARSFETPEAIEVLRQGEPPEHFPGLTAVHPMSTVAMDDDPTRGPVDSRGKHHGLEGLWVADGSLFPTSVGVPPQLSIYAMGLHVGRHLVAAG